MEETLYFFDSHCHTMTLGQVNISTFLNNLNSHGNFELYKTLLGDFSGDISPKKGFKQIMNLLNVMQNDLVDIFNLMEDDLKGIFDKNSEPKIRDNILKMNNKSYSKLVLTPLLMDFRVSEQEGNITYYPLPEKSIETVINEYSFAINQYHKNRPNGILSIMPFLGINPKVYSFKELELLLEKTFGSYQLIRRSFSSIKVNQFLTRMAGQVSPHSLFSGIKLYPPMGFNPWPDDPGERQKVEFLYDFCEKKEIPITTHCNKGGFITILYNQAFSFTSPKTWSSVLKHYPKLRLNFAHAGYEELSPVKNFFKKDEMSWTQEIFNLILSYENVYTDISFNGITSDFYVNFKGMIDRYSQENQNIIKRRVLYGTDFMINLTSIGSYKDYYSLFDSSCFLPEERHLFSSINPMNFLGLFN